MGGPLCICTLCTFLRPLLVAEHKRAVKNAEPEKSALCEHLTLFDPRVNWEESTVLKNVNSYQRWSRGHKTRGQGQGHKKNPRPRPRTAFPRTDTLEAKDRNARGQDQGPRTQAQVLSNKKKKKGLHKNFLGDLKKKKGLHKNFFGRFKKKKGLHKNFNNSKNSAVFEPRTGQFSRT